MTPGTQLLEPAPSESSRDDFAAIHSVVADATEDIRRQADERGPASVEVRGPGVAALLLPPLIVLLTWIWVAPPAMLLPTPPPPIPTMAAEAGLRMFMGVQATRIEAFRGRTGRLPAALEEVGNVTPAVSYTRISATTYALLGSVDGVEVDWRSSQGVEVLLPDGLPYPLEGGS